MSSLTREHGPGLRERKRAALYSAIERTAMDLVVEHGYEKVTVEEICQASMISSRTFFNYFGSKEAAILGGAPPLPTDEEIDAFATRADGNVLEDFVALVAPTLLEPDPGLFRARRLVLQRTPELLSRQMVRMGELEDQFVRIVLTRLRAQVRDSGAEQELEEEQELEDEARMLVALATGVLRYTMRKRISGDFAGSTRELLDSAIRLVRRVTATPPHGIQAPRHPERNSAHA
ncbi:MAG: TetR/AcrR family transcriptional regulator [Actinomycetales bacterium]